MANTQTTKEKIKLLEQKELEELSLQETLSAEEAVCDAMEPRFLVETADLPKSDSDLAGMADLKSDGDFDKYQFFNQDQVMGVTDEDLYDITNPDKPLTGTSINEDGSAVKAASDSVARAEDPDRNLAAVEMPPVSDITDEKKRLNETDFSSATSIMASLLAEDSADDAAASNDGIIPDDDDDSVDLPADFDEAAFLKGLDGDGSDADAAASADDEEDEEDED
jgi:hypothetical protein